SAGQGVAWEALVLPARPDGSVFDADLPEHPLTPDTSIYRSVGMNLNAPLLFQSLIAPFGMQHFSYVPSFGILSTYPPTPCGLATFSAALAAEHGVLGREHHERGER